MRDSLVEIGWVFSLALRDAVVPYPELISAERVSVDAPP
jgi:hypothetical protein